MKSLNTYIKEGFFQNVGALTPNECLIKFAHNSKIRNKKSSIILITLVNLFREKQWITNEDLIWWLKDFGLQFGYREKNGKIEIVDSSSRIGIANINGKKTFVIRPVRQSEYGTDDRTSQFEEALMEIGYKFKKGNDAPRGGRAGDYIDIDER